jgi:NAD(P)-dependent dehydrogenase (short-subunit alcohol dehydrogenase family)
MSVYSATKGALLSLTRTATVELAPRRIRVNAVAPGMTRTPLSRHVDRRSTERATTDATVPAGIPQRRLATPEIVAAAIAYLAADEAAHITGPSLPVDGDFTAT